jgi:hypothetical protein
MALVGVFVLIFNFVRPSKHGLNMSTVTAIIGSHDGANKVEVETIQ